MTSNVHDVAPKPVIRLCRIWLSSYNQRTSGPVNAHLTPGPGIYFNAFIHVYSPRAGADNPLGTNVDVNRKPLSLCLFVASFKTISLKYDFKHILNDFIHVYSHGARAENPFQNWDKLLMSTESPYHFDHMLQVSNKSLWILILHIFLMFFNMYIAPLWTKSWCQQKIIVTLPICCKFQKNISLKSDFIRNFLCFYTCI